MPERKIVLKHCGVIDPCRIDTYLAQDGFKAHQKVLTMKPEQVIEEVKSSGLRGRGGAGFPAGSKWQFALKSPGDEKYVICNADEGEVGTFKDRYMLEKDPFTLIEGIAIASHAVGASRAFIYLRAEYYRLLGRLEDAISQAKTRGLLPNVDIAIRVGAGAYVCGEESALMDSIEGKRGEARFKPPFPPSVGLMGKPTVINNVETLMNVPQILLNGAAWFSKFGTETSKGTKVFSLSGDVGRPGVYELEMGSTLRELVQGLGKAEPVKMIQIGGATGRLVTGDMLDAPLAFESILGAGAIFVMNQSRDVVEVAYRTMEFLAEECCGKCVPCREGTEVMLEVLGRLRSGEGREQDLPLLERLSRVMPGSALCGLGQAAPTVVSDSLQYFKDAYLAGIAGSPVAYLLSPVGRERPT